MTTLLMNKVTCKE